MTEGMRILTEDVCDHIGVAREYLRKADIMDVDVPVIRLALERLNQAFDAFSCRHHMSNRTHYALAALGTDRAIVSYKCNTCGTDTSTVMPMTDARNLVIKPRL